MIILLALGSAGWAQAIDPQAELLRADALITDSRYEEAMAILEGLSRDYPGQPVDAKARMNVAYIQGAVRQDLAAARATYQSVVQDFPDTVMALYAGLAVADTLRKADDDSRSPGFQAYMAQVDAAIVRAGGVSIYAPVLDPAEIRPVPFLTPEEQQDVLVDLYVQASSGLTSGAIVGQFSNANPDLATARHAIRVYLVPWEAYPELFTYRELRELRWDAADVLGVQLPETRDHDTTPPTVTVVSPPEGAVVREARPRIAFSLSDGDIRQNQVQLEDTRIHLDGQPITGWSLDLEVELEDPEATFLVATLAFVPSVDLVPGAHTVRVQAQDQLTDLVTVKEWSFTVTDQPLSLSLPVARDTLLRANKPHLNEGANPQLALGPGPHDRSLVAFDLVGVDLAGLQGAQLVLTLSQPVTGAGHGQGVEVARLSEGWAEGNGRDFGLKKKDRTPGSGPGATWFSPTDTDIRNDDPDGSGRWDGTGLTVLPPTSPPATVTNHQTGEVVFDVTQDVLAGAGFGWVVRKQGAGGNIFFYSREGASAAELAPRLILDFGGTASSGAGRLQATGNGQPLVLLRRSEGLELGRVHFEVRAVRRYGPLLAGLAARAAFPWLDLPVRTLWALESVA